MLKVKLLTASAKAPTIAHPGEDLGYDLYASEAVRIPPRGCAVRDRHLSLSTRKRRF